MKKTTVEEARAARGTTEYLSVGRVQYNEELLDELLMRVEALEDGTNWKQAPEFKEGAAP